MAKSKPNYARFLNNDEVCLEIYALRFPELKINPDFELKKSIVSVGTQHFKAYYEQKLFEFILEKELAPYNGDKFGWTGEYAGVNREGIDLCLSSGFDLKIITSEKQYIFHKSVIEEAVAKKWIMSSNDRPRLFYLPIQYSGKTISHQNNTKLDEF